jgi:hypothetical protein
MVIENLLMNRHIYVCVISVLYCITQAALVAALAEVPLRQQVLAAALGVVEELDLNLALQVRTLRMGVICIRVRLCEAL